MALKLPLACAVSILFVGIVFVNAVALSPNKPVQETGWVTTVFKNRTDPIALRITKETTDGLRGQGSGAWIASHQDAERAT